jgi:hypothetical protein
MVIKYLLWRINMKTLTIEKSVRDNIKVRSAIIIGLNQRYGFERKFSGYRYINDCSSKHVYYDYYINAEEGDFIETCIKSSYKNKRAYFKLVNNEFISITTKEISNYFRNKDEEIS